MLETIHGHPSYPEIIKEACQEHTDIIIAVNESDEINMFACQIAHTLCKVNKKIAKISSPHYLARHELFGDNNLPIDVFINTEKLVIKMILDCIKHPGAQQIYRLDRTQTLIVKVQVQPNSPMVSLMVNQIDRSLPDEITRIIQVKRNGHQSTFDDYDVIKPFDTLHIICQPNSIDNVLKLFHPKQSQTHSIIIGEADKKQKH